MTISEKQIKKFKKIYKEKNGNELSDKEAYEAASNVLHFFEILYKGAVEETIKKRKLKKYPKGFHLEDDIYSCLVCHKEIAGKESWYDKLGPKCLTCQKAIDKKVIPKYVCRDRDSWYAMWELKDKFGIHPATAKKMMREGKLKARVIKDDKGRDYFYVFLIKENKMFL